MSKSSQQIKGLSLDRLETLTKVVRNGGVARASEGDSNKQSLFSRQIHELEEAMGITLMDRNSSPHQPTSAAIALVESTEALFRQFQLLRQESDLDRSELVIGAGDRMIRSYLLPFLARQPREGVRIVLRNLKSSAIRSGLMNHSIHLGIMRVDRVPNGCEHFTLPSIPVGLFAPSAMRPKNGKWPWEQVITSPLVSMEGEGKIWQHWQTEAKVHGLMLDAAIQCSSWSQVAECMRSMGLAGFLPVDVARLYGQDLVECPVIGASVYRDSYAIAWYAAMAKKNPALQQLIKKLLQKNK
jgi:DNA-binding transcriptional LysR family regulator